MHLLQTANRSQIKLMGLAGYNNPAVQLHTTPFVFYFWTSTITQSSVWHQVATRHSCFHIFHVPRNLWCFSTWDLPKCCEDWADSCVTCWLLMFLLTFVFPLVFFFSNMLSKDRVNYLNCCNVEISQTYFKSIMNNVLNQPWASCTIILIFSVFHGN